MKFWQTNAPEFIDHGIGHYVRIIERLDQLVPDSMMDQMSALEVYILLCGTWLHDIGMLVKERKGEKFTPKVDRFKRSSKIKRCPQFEFDSLLFNAQKERKMSEISTPKMVRGVRFTHEFTSKNMPKICFARVRTSHRATIL